MGQFDLEELLLQRLLKFAWLIKVFCAVAWRGILGGQH